MKSFGFTSVAIAAATWFAASVAADLDPIVIKVTAAPRTDSAMAVLLTMLFRSGFQILLQDKWHRIVGVDLGKEMTGH